MRNTRAIRFMAAARWWCTWGVVATELTASGRSASCDPCTWQEWCQGQARARRTPQHKVYPYLLRGVPVVRSNQVWSTDITYVRLERGFAYLVAIIDWYSRRVLSWRISNSMDGRGRAYATSL